MNKVFEITKPFRVPDGTLVSPFLNSRDCMSGLPFDILAGVSISAGVIEPHQQSKIHVMPFVTQITFVWRGDLLVKMKGPDDQKPYLQPVAVAQAVITEPGILFQLINETDKPCEVLYIVSPAYLFEMAEDKVVYDDSLVLEESWNELEAADWHTRSNLPTLEERQNSEQRMLEKAKLVKAKQTT
jgi:hypothetical protein